MPAGPDSRRIGVIAVVVLASIGLGLALLSSGGSGQAGTAVAAAAPQRADSSHGARSDPIDRVPIHRITVRAEKTFGRRYAGQWIDRHVKPPVLRIAVVDATRSDQRTLARISHHSPQVALASVKFTFHRILAAKAVVEKVFERRHVDFIEIEPSLIEQRVIVVVPKPVKRSIRRTIARRAGRVPIHYRVKPLRTIPASTRKHRWKVPKYVYRHGHHRRIVLRPSSRKIPIAMQSGYCVGDPKPSISRADLVETARSITITAYLHKPRVKIGGACAGVGLELVRNVHLAARLGDRGLFDGATTPPRPVPHGR